MATTRRKLGAKRQPAGDAGGTQRRAASAKAKRTKAASKAKPAPARAGRKAPRRADFGSPIEPFFAKQPPHLRAVLDALRALVEEAAPDATASIKWGMPFFAVGGEMACALGAHRSHVNLILAGPPDAFPDRDGRLEGGGKNGRHLKLRAVDELPRTAVRGWLRIAVAGARERAGGR